MHHRLRTTSTNFELHCYLIDAYQGRLNCRICRGRLTDAVRVDDQYGDIHRLFCKIAVTISHGTPGAFQIKLTNTPMTDELRDLIESSEGEVLEIDDRTDAIVNTSIKSVTYIRDLAAEYRRTVGRGAEYDNSNWIWICRRTADSLNRLASNITGFRRYFRRPG